MRGRRFFLRSFWITIGVGLVVLIVLQFGTFFQRPAQTPSAPVASSPEADNPDSDLVSPQADTSEAVQKEKIRIALVIDDMGYSIKAFRSLVDLGVPMTFSILPGLRYSRAIAGESNKLAYEVMLHLPMEPTNPALDPGPGAIVHGMTLDEVRLRTRQDLHAIPYALGVNNHMGSRVTEDVSVMEAVLDEIRKEHLYFLDSRTSPHSVAYPVAKKMGVRSAERQVFLDDSIEIPMIRRQMDLLEKIAERRGQAIAIGHPHAQTIAVLRERLPELQGKGIEFVFLSRLMPEP